jgi:hypothetical protein
MEFSSATLLRTLVKPKRTGIFVTSFLEFESFALRSGVNDTGKGG